MRTWWWILALVSPGVLGAQTVPWEQLRTAAPEVVKGLVAKGMTFTGTDKTEAVVRVMSVNPNPDVLPVLMAAGADVQGLWQGYNALEAAAGANPNPAVLTALSNAGVKPRANLLSLACQYNPNLSMLQGFVQGGADFKSTDKGLGYVSMVMAGQAATLEKLEFVLKQGAPADVLVSGKRALLAALSLPGDAGLPWAALLLRYGANPNGLSGESPSPGTLARWNEQPEALLQLLLAGWQVKTPEGALDMEGFRAVGISLLVADAQPADIKAAIPRWLALAAPNAASPAIPAVQVVLKEALARGRSDVVSAVFAWGGGLKLGRPTSELGATPLLAALNGPTPTAQALVELVLAQGGDPKVGKDRAALPLAAERYGAGVVRALLAAGASPLVAVQASSKDRPRSALAYAKTNPLLSQDAAILTLLAGGATTDARMASLAALPAEVKRLSALVQGLTISPSSSILHQVLTTDGFLTEVESPLINFNWRWGDVVGISVMCVAEFRDSDGRSLTLNFLTDNIGLGSSRADRLFRLSVGARGYGVQFASSSDFEARLSYWTSMLAAQQSLRDLARKATTLWAAQPVYVGSVGGVYENTGPEVAF